MFSNSKAVLVAAALIAAPLAGAMAQQNNPQGNLGANSSMSATPGTSAHGAAGSADMGSHGTTTSNYAGSATTNKPGSTGKTIVPGNKSTTASDRPATAEQQKGAQMQGGGR